MACVAWFCILIILNVLVLLQGSRPWSHKQLFPSSQIPEGALSPERPITKKKILEYHNFFRTKVQPTASNMLKMTWHPAAARQAQEYAERCVYLTHNPNEERVVSGLGSCGQNLFVASQKTTWFFAIKAWFLEYQNFTYGVPVTDLKPVGHYTQMVWATTHKVGCGFAHCPGGVWGQFYNYVCHYCPGGNIDTKTHYPYKVGPSCGDCPDHCSMGKLCTNPCNEMDYYSNCDDLMSSGYNLCSQGVCNATCHCGDKRIHKNHPWL